MTTSTEAAWQAVEVPVRGYLRRRLGRDDGVLDDLAQEVLVRLDSGLPHLAHPERLGAWVQRIAHNVLVDHWRRQRTEPLDGHEPRVEDHPDDAAVPEAISLFLRTVLDQLEPDHRSIIELVDIGGLTGPEAAQRLGISLSAAKARLHRGRATVRAAIERCCAVIRDGRGTPIDYQRRRPDDDCGC